LYYRFTTSLERVKCAFVYPRPKSMLPNYNYATTHDGGPSTELLHMLSGCEASCLPA